MDDFLVCGFGCVGCGFGEGLVCDGEGVVVYVVIFDEVV